MGAQLTLKCTGIGRNLNIVLQSHQHQCRVDASEIEAEKLTHNGIF